MMNVKTFLENVFRLELDAYNASKIPDLEDYNRKVDVVHSYFVREMKDTLLLKKKDRLQSNDYYVARKDFKFKYPRFIFKISQYENDRYGTVYLAYVSAASLNRVKFVRYGNCFFVIRQDNDYKIASGYFLYDEYPDNIRWMKHGGYDDLLFENAGKLMAVERYIEPLFSESYPEESNFSIEEHRAER